MGQAGRRACRRPTGKGRGLICKWCSAGIWLIWSFREKSVRDPVKILIIKPSALGDIVQALPVLTGLKRRWPAAEIDWIVNDSLREILEGHPCLRQTILYPRKRWTCLLYTSRCV